MDDLIKSTQDNFYYQQLIIEKFYNKDLISIDELSDILNKGYSIVNIGDIEKAEKDLSHLIKKEVLVNRGGKTFKQTVYVKKDEPSKIIETPIGEELSPVVSGMNITKYSDKSMLITGDTYVNVDTLRSIKNDIGVGNWNAKLKGWIFPISFLDKILGALWSNQINEGNEEKANAIMNQKNSSLNVGDKITLNDDNAEIEENVSDSEGIKYNVKLNDGTKLNEVNEKVIDVVPEKDDQKIAEIFNNTTPENRVKSEKQIYGIKSIENIYNYSLSEYLKMHGLTDEDIQSAINLFQPKDKTQSKVSSAGNSKTYSSPTQTSGLTKKQLIAKLIYKHYNAVKAAIENGEKLKPEVLDIYSDLKESYSKKRQAMSEETKRKISEALKKNKVEEIPNKVIEVVKDDFIPVKNKQVQEEQDKLAEMLIERESLNKKKFNLYEQSRNTQNALEKIDLTTKAREIGYKIDPLEKQIRKQRNVVQVLVNNGSLKSVSDKIGVNYNNVPDFTKVDTNNISYDIDNILTIEKPPYIPEINEEEFKSGGYIFDTIKIDNDTYLLATNRYREFSEVREGFNIKRGEYDPEGGGFAILTLDQLVLTQDYYTTKQKALNKQKADERNKRQVEAWHKKDDSMKERYLMQRGIYKALPAKVKKKISESEWDKMTWREREKHYIPVKVYGVERLKSQFDEKHMANSFHSMYERFVNPDAQRKDKNGKLLSRGESSYGKSYANSEAWKSWESFRETLDWKINDINIQREEVVSDIRKKALETSYGESNTNDVLVADYGIKVKRQNGEIIKSGEIEQLKNAWVDVQKTFGSLKENAKEDNLKLSHAGKTFMYASKAIGVYYPSMQAIGVTAKLGEDQLGFTMGHEVAHWIDNTLGRKEGRRHMSDNYDSTAGKIAITFRKNMNAESKSNYTNSTHECFARALEQYHAIESQGADALMGKTDLYVNSKDYVSFKTYESKIKPLIQQFFQENKEILKGFI